MTKHVPTLTLEMQTYIERYGFILHYIPSKYFDNKLMDMHTHFLEESFEHPDLQIIANTDVRYAQSIIHTLVNNISRGERYQDGDIIYGFFKDITTPLEFKIFRESDREVLRVILPDSSGLLPSDEGCDPAYQVQYEEYIPALNGVEILL